MAMEMSIYGKIPPQSKELEQAVLGAIMLDGSAIDIATDILPPGAFYVDAHNRIYRAACELAARNQRVDLLLVVEELRKSEELDIVGGPYYVTQLTNFVVSSANIETHCRIILQKFLAREMIRITSEFCVRAYDDSEDIFDLLESMEQKVLEIGTKHISSPVISMDEVMKRAIAKIEYWRTMDTSLTGVTSGFREIDRATRGWQPQDLIIIAARPSVGKTAFALNLARNAAVAGTPVAMFSLEMNAVSQGLRMLSAESEQWMVSLQTGRLDDLQMQTVFHKGVKKLANLPIYFEENTNVTISRFRVTARRMYKKLGVRLFIIDYLQLMSGDTNEQNREREISKISRELKRLAMELDVPIIALSQLSREIEKRSNPEPLLSDLRESGAIEQDADVVAFLWAPTDEDVVRDPSLAKTRYVKIGKQRNGVLARERVRFDNHIQKFSDALPEELPAGNWTPVQTVIQEKLPL